MPFAKKGKGGRLTLAGQDKARAQPNEAVLVFLKKYLQGNQISNSAPGWHRFWPASGPAAGKLQAVTYITSHLLKPHCFPC
ncbi:MAG: hypothetical protein EBT70_14090 [Betaproteobacteria bacterium]|nr:hypothetical protein [Betaproteobacteria bacterium]